MHIKSQSLDSTLSLIQNCAHVGCLVFNRNTMSWYYGVNIDLKQSIDSTVLWAILALKLYLKHDCKGYY